MTIAQIATRTPRHAASLPWLFLALLVAVVSQVFIAVLFGSLAGSDRASWVVASTLCVGLGLPTATILLACWMTRDQTPPFALAAIVIAGLVMRLVYFGSGPALEDDHFRYQLDGAMIAHGLNPYAVSPQALITGSAPEAYQLIGDAGRSVLLQINFPELRSIYPGVAQLLFGLAHGLAPWTVDGLRAVILACEILTALLCWRLLVAMGLPAHWMALLWCNPMLAFCLTGQAHIDAALGPPLLAMLLAIRQSKGSLAGVALGLAVGIKLWPIMLTPVVVRSLGADRRAQLACLIVLGLVATAACAPLLHASLFAQSGLVAFASGWHMNNLPYEWVSYALYQFADGAGLERYLRAVVTAAAAAVAVTLALRPIRDLQDIAARLALVTAAVFYLSPAQFPWYAAWFAPFAVLAGNWALLAATAALPTYFLFFPMAGTAWGDVYRYGLSGLHLLPVVVIALLVWLRRGRVTA
jgi:alpha-1,6-mannosyltransferase